MFPVQSEQHLQISEQSSSESAPLHPELNDDPLGCWAAGMAEAISSEDLPMQPDSTNQTRNSLQDSAHTQLSPVPSPEKLAPPPSEGQPVPPPLSQRNTLLVRRKTTPVLAKVKDSRTVGAEAAPPIRARSALANQYLQNIGHLRSAEGDHTFQLAKDPMGIETTMEQTDNGNKEEFEELTLKLPDAEQSMTSQADQQQEADAKPNDFATLPVCGRIAFWRERETDAFCKSRVADSKVCKQDRSPISASVMRPDPQQ
ncbi:uncharacterized protein LOC119436178 [Dermacentor silvarum]|uniref:uncharacterized protein LOC119436178 n=1 Tax=Dermacentor silvarum TaxID=543639 RepID=UPI001897B176|nr:uncharacterized protein LOC119436178 [Dermacentor silvarum]